MLMDLAKALKAGTWSSQRYVEMTELFMETVYSASAPQLKYLFRFPGTDGQ
jgi:hypothetical protein